MSGKRMKFSEKLAIDKDRSTPRPANSSSWGLRLAAAWMERYGRMCVSVWRGGHHQERSAKSPFWQSRPQASPREWRPSPRSRRRWRNGGRLGSGKVEGEPGILVSLGHRCPTYLLLIIQGVKNLAACRLGQRCPSLPSARVPNPKLA